MFDHHCFNGLGDAGQEPFVFVARYLEEPLRVDAVGADAAVDVEA